MIKEFENIPETIRKEKEQDLILDYLKENIRYFK